MVRALVPREGLHRFQERRDLNAKCGPGGAADGLLVGHGFGLVVTGDGRIRFDLLAGRASDAVQNNRDYRQPER